MKFGQDQNGAYKILDDGRVLRVVKQFFNAKLTLSQSFDEPMWEHGW